MAGRVRSLNVAVKADTRKFRKGMKRSRSSLSKFVSAVRTGATGMAKFGAATALVAAGALVLIVKKNAAVIDSMAKLSDRIGITTEALAGLQYGAQITGAGTEALDKSMQFLAKALGEAKTGIGEGKQALDLLGLSVEDLLKLDPARQMEVLADSFATLATQEEKAFVASKLFGRSGVALVNLLAVGSAGLQQFAEKAKKFRLAFTREEAAKVEAMNDALTDFSGVLAGAGRGLTIEIAPFIEAATKAMTELATTGEGLGPKIASGIEQAVLAVTALVAKFERLRVAIRAVVGALIGTGTFGGIFVGSKKLDEALGPLVSLDEIQRREVRDLEAIRNVFAEIRVQAEKNARIVADKARRKQITTAPVIDIPDIRTANAPEAFGRLFEGVKAKAFAVAQAIEPVYMTMAGNVKRAWDDIVAAQNEIRDRGLRAQENAAAFAGAAAGTLKSTIGDAVFDGFTSGFKNLDDIMTAFRDRLTQIIIDSFIEAAAGRQIEQMFTGLFSNIFGAPASGGGGLRFQDV